MARSKEISSVGKPRVVDINNMLIKAALGILAAPMLAKVAVKLIIIKMDVGESDTCILNKNINKSYMLIDFSPDCYNFSDTQR